MPGYHSPMTITAAVDGSSLGNPGPAGWAWVVSEDCWDAGGWDMGTNNLGELTAVLQLLLATESAGLAGEELHILADSQYAINVITKWRHSWKKRGWAKAGKQPIKNLELIQELDRVIEGRAVTFEWVKGHAGHHLNEMADERARACAQAYQDGRRPPSGPGFTGSGLVAATGPERPTDPAHPASPAHPEASDSSQAALVEDLHRRFLQAWSTGDTETLDSLTAPQCHRIWPDGTVTSTLAGPVPASPAVGRIEARHLGEGVWLVCHRMRWQGGSSFESALWVRSSDPVDSSGPAFRLTHHQSTRVS